MAIPNQTGLGNIPYVFTSKVIDGVSTLGVLVDGAFETLPQAGVEVPNQQLLGELQTSGVMTGSTLDGASVSKVWNGNGYTNIASDVTPGESVYVPSGTIPSTFALIGTSPAPMPPNFNPGGPPLTYTQALQIWIKYIEDLVTWVLNSIGISSSSNAFGPTWNEMVEAAEVGLEVFIGAMALYAGAEVMAAALAEASAIALSTTITMSLQSSLASVLSNGGVTIKGTFFPVTTTAVPPVPLSFTNVQVSNVFSVLEADLQTYLEAENAAWNNVIQIPSIFIGAAVIIRAFLNLISLAIDYVGGVISDYIVGNVNLDALAAATGGASAALATASMVTAIISYNAASSSGDYASSDYYAGAAAQAASIASMYSIDAQEATNGAISAAYSSAAASANLALQYLKAASRAIESNDQASADADIVLAQDALNSLNTNLSAALVSASSFSVIQSMTGGTVQQNDTTITMTSATTSGNAVVVFIGPTANSTPVVTDDGGNMYTVVPSGGQWSDFIGQIPPTQLWLAYSLNCHTATQVTISSISSDGYTDAIILECVGLKSFDVINPTLADFDAWGAEGGGVHDRGNLPITTTQAPDVVLSWWYSSDVVGTESTLAYASIFDSNPNTTYADWLVEYQIANNLGVPGTYLSTTEDGGAPLFAVAFKIQG